MAERLRLGLAPETNMPLHSACSEPNGQYEFDPWHGLSCVQDKGVSITRRHDAIKHGLAQWASRLGGQVRVEPRNLHVRYGGAKARRRRGQRGRREAERKERGDGKAKPFKPNADLLITGLGPVPILVDTTVRHARAPSLVVRCAGDEERVLKEAEAEKHRDYDGLAESIGAKFFAFAVESTGRLGKEALELIRLLIKEGARFKNVWQPKEVVQGIYRTVAIAIARGNADIIDENLRRARQAPWEAV